jgi:hypothetical protein
MSPNFIQDFHKGQKNFAESLRLLVLQEDEELFLKLDFNDDVPFLEPFLFLFYRQKLLLASEQTNPITLRQVLFGYISKKNLPDQFSFLAFVNANGKVYLPKIGYFSVELTNQSIEITYSKTTKKFSLSSNNGDIEFKFSPLQFIKNSNIELYQFHDPVFDSLYANWFTKTNESRTVNHLPPIKFAPVPLFDHNRAKIDYAYSIIKKSGLNYSKLIDEAAKGVYSFEQETLWSFSAQYAHGIGFLCGHPDESMIFFFVELAHQIGHAIFDCIIFNRDSVFSENPETPMAILTDNPHDDRTLIDATHGLFTVAKVVELLNYLYSIQDKLGLDKEMKHEILGRLSEYYFIHRNGLQKVDHEKYFTPRGRNIYTILDNYLVRVFRKYGDLPIRYRYKKGEYVFNYQDFKAAHPLI